MDTFHAVNITETDRYRQSESLHDNNITLMLGMYVC